MPMESKNTKRAARTRGWIIGSLTCLAVATGLAVAQLSPSSVAQLSPSSSKEFEDFDPRNFARSTEIDNEWFPLKPGTQFTYEGFTSEEGVAVPHRVVFTVTDLTKVIGGVRTVVGYDLDYSAGLLSGPPTPRNSPGLLILPSTYGRAFATTLATFVAWIRDRASRGSFATAYVA